MGCVARYQRLFHTVGHLSAGVPQPAGVQVCISLAGLAAGMAQLGLHVIQGSATGDYQGRNGVAAGMDAYWPFNPRSLEHPVKWSGNVVERLALFLSWKQIGVSFNGVGLLEDLHGHMVEVEDPAFPILGVGDEQGQLGLIEVFPLGQPQLILTQSCEQQQFDVLTGITVFIDIRSHKQPSDLPFVQIAGALVVLGQALEMSHWVLLQITHSNTPSQDRFEQGGDPVVGGWLYLAQQVGLQGLALLKLYL